MPTELGDKRSAEPTIESSDLGSRLDSLDQRIDDIVAFQARKAPWYRDGSLVISGSAFLISIVTTIAAWYHSYRQDLSATTAQLAATLQQASDLQRLSFDYSDKYQNNNAALAAISSMINQENVQLANQAYSLARALGRNASATQLTNVAFALTLSDLSLLSEELVRDAIPRAVNSVEYVSALRLQGMLQFKLGNPTQGNKSYQLASEAFDKFPAERSEYYEDLTQAYTQFY